LRSSGRRNHQNIVSFDSVIGNFSQRVVNRGGVSVSLTEKECDTLKFMIENAERVISRDELLAKVWGYENQFRTRTVDQHILHLRGKLERDPRHPVHLRTMSRVGYKFVL
jgi:two-component system, OmpR family, alkaline phosphatase synthesis response regulator PhoP